ncbi:hypothetical protein [Aquisalimonas sp.]|uniref:hypothetical protein n=1 Tax=Aquisalimonas sp. TaxID=1872621 RepID=UPI0025B957FF|nr:hypothetical protein [Aquisalimonas sp.]
MMMNEGYLALHTLSMALFALVVIVPFWRMCTKAGFAGWWSLLVVIPLVNLVFLYFWRSLNGRFTRSRNLAGLIANAGVADHRG